MTPHFPDFFLVGAPKCGTTALYEFLGQHPEIFVPGEKELLFFARDLSFPTRLSEGEFLAHFAGRDAESLCGTAHTAYMQSRTAAREIAEVRPDARIIAMLRDPAEMLPSWHSELLYETIEEIPDIEGALDAEADRRAGRRIPRSARNSYVEALYYSDVARYAEQLRRFRDAFGETQVHVILHEDLRERPEETYRDALSFLGVDAGFQPQFATHNVNKRVRSRALQRAIFATSLPGHRAVRNLIPRRLRQRILSANASPAQREPLPAAAKARIVRCYRDEVDQLEILIGRDLSGWLS